MGRLAKQVTVSVVSAVKNLIDILPLGCKQRKLPSARRIMAELINGQLLYWLQRIKIFPFLPCLAH